MIDVQFTCCSHLVLADKERKKILRDGPQIGHTILEYLQQQYLMLFDHEFHA